MEEYDTAVEHFERALDLAKQLNDEDTQAAIMKAMEDVNSKLTAAIPGTKGKERLELGEGSGTADDQKKEEESLASQGATSETSYALPRPHEAKSI